MLGGFATARAQTSVFTYQGRLNDTALAANGTYNMQFALFDAISGGAQIGSTITFDGVGTNPASVTVTNGIFTAQLNFGASAFPGVNRFLAIAVKRVSDPPTTLYTPLTPLQPVNSSPYSIQALNAATATTATNATQLGGVAANQYVQTADSRLSDSRTPNAGSPNYIQNATLQQASSNFNIGGNGTAGGTLSGNILNATTQYNLDGNRALSIAGAFFANSDTFAGVGAGTANVASGSQLDGNLNSFFGYQAGNANNTGCCNSFFGAQAGLSNTSGFSNSFFGINAGNKNNIGTQNSFFGDSAGFNNVSNINNAFFGYHAGIDNTSDNNSFFGHNAGQANTMGDSNSFFGEEAGNANKTGTGNSFFGTGAGLLTTGSNNTFIGRSAGTQTTTGFNNTFFGISAGFTNRTGDHLTLVGANTDVAIDGLSFATAIGAGSIANFSDTVVLGRSADVVQIPGLLVTSQSVNVGGNLNLGNVNGGGSIPLCIPNLTVGKTVGVCSSSLRYKTDVNSFLGGLDIIKRLRPISFTWKEGGMRDLGFGAEEVEKIEPLLTFKNADGQIEGVKYNQISAVLVNSVKEQQEQIKRQQQEIDGLKKLVCADHRKAELCQAH